MATSKENETSTKHITHWVIHALYGIVLACGGFITSQIFGQLEKLEEKVDEAPMVYVQKADYKDDQANLTQALRDLGDKIEHSSEYMEADYNRRMDKLEELLTKRLQQ